MNRDALQRRIQLLLSWREQAGRQVRAAQPKNPLKRGAFRAHARQADFYLRRTIDENQGLLEKLGVQLQAALAEIGRVERQAASGRIRNEDAALVRAELERRIQRLRDEIALYNQLLRARRSSDAGGFIDLPLDQYAPALGILPLTRRRDRWEPRHYAIIALVALIASLGAYAYYRNATAVHLQCSGEYQRTPSEALLLRLENVGMAPVRLHAPWPSPIPQGMLSPDCGLNVYALQPERGDYQLVPTSPADWKDNGTAIAGREFLPLPPGMSETLMLDLGSLRARVRSLSGVRVDTTDGSGRVLCSQEWEALPAPPAPLP